LSIIDESKRYNFKRITLRELKEDEVLIKVKACSVCGHDMIMASYGATEMQPFGHEISGSVEKVGRLVKNVMVGDQVVLESGTFDRFSNASRNGRVDLDNKGSNFWVKDDDNMGVALDLIKTADIKLGNTVLVMGLGPIGLMAAKMAKASGAIKVYATELPECKARIELAKKWRVDEVFAPNSISVKVDRVLVTAPPKVIPSAFEQCNIGAIVAFLGIDYGNEGFVTFDSNIVHFNKLQLRASHASPALYFPECIELIKAGIVNTEELITHRFKIEKL